MRFFGFSFPDVCLDEEFDAPDETDNEVRRALVAGRIGVHPDGWGSHAPLTTPPPRFRRVWEEEESPAYTPPVDRKRLRRRPAELYRPAQRWPDPPPTSQQWDNVPGVIQLDCDECEACFRMTAHYARGERDDKAALLRIWGRAEGWTHIVGRDRCPRCSSITAPEYIGNSAGESQGHNQHA